ncbi:major facilitator superfamily domain-containing protein [Trichoderma barbatum]
MADDSDLSSIPPIEKTTTNTETSGSELYVSQPIRQRRGTYLEKGLHPQCHLLCSSAVIETFVDITQLAWLGAGITLGSLALSLKYLCIGGIVLFELGSVLCGAALSMSALIVGRVIAGMGGTGMYLGDLNHISAFTTREERGTCINGTGFVWGLGAYLGLVIGGPFSVSKATWCWVLYINLVIGAASAPIYIFNLPKVQPVRDGHTVAIVIVFGLLTILYMLQQYFQSSQFQRPSHVRFMCFGPAAFFTAIYIPIYFIPIYFQFVRDDTALKAAVRLLPFLLVAVASKLASGYLLSKLKYYMPMYLVSGILVTVGGSLATLKVKPEDIAKSLSMQNVSHIGGTTIALIIAVFVFESAATRNIEGQVRTVVAGAQSTLFEQLSGDMKTNVILAITRAMQAPFILVIVAGAVIIISTAAMKREKLFGEIVAVGEPKEFKRHIS